MPFALLADEFHSDPKTIKATLAGAGLYARALSYCGHYSTDGFVPHAWAAEVATASIRKKVTDAGFWVAVVGGEVYRYVFGGESYVVTITEKGYFIPDYVAFNPTRASVLEKRAELSAKRSEAGKKGAAIRWQRDLTTLETVVVPDSKSPVLPSALPSELVANAKQPDSPLPLPLKDPKAVTSQETSGARGASEQPRDFVIPEDLTKGIAA